jgi:hypothetical protein
LAWLGAIDSGSVHTQARTRSAPQALCTGTLAAGRPARDGPSGGPSTAAPTEELATHKRPTPCGELFAAPWRGPVQGMPCRHKFVNDARSRMHLVHVALEVVKVALLVAGRLERTAAVCE